MSDTPRTDEAENAIRNGDYTPLLDESREIERELNEWKAKATARLNALEATGYGCDRTDAAPAEDAPVYECGQCDMKQIISGKCACMRRVYS